MDASRTAGAELPAGRFDGLHAEAQSALTYAANTLRGVREQYREAYAEATARWQELREELETAERRRPAVVDRSAEVSAEEAAEAGAEDARMRALRAEVERLADELGVHQSQLSRLGLAQRSLESTWLFLERGDATLINDGTVPASATDVEMRIIEAQEAERIRLAQEIHDGPAQSLSNAIFQVEYIERVLTQDIRLARTELRYLRELLRRELGDVRSFISQLRPPALDELGLEGALADTIDHMAAITGLEITREFAAPTNGLADAEQTVVLRVTQEALQNVRKHAAASKVHVATRREDANWVLEVRDDGRGFDDGEVAARGRRNFGLVFMRERAELIGATFDVRSRPDEGTVVRLAIPTAGKESR